MKSIKNPIKLFFIFFSFIKSETNVSFVNHFNGQFAYLKTLDFYFKAKEGSFCFVLFFNIQSTKTVMSGRRRRRRLCEPVWPSGKALGW